MKTALTAFLVLTTCTFFSLFEITEAKAQILGQESSEESIITPPRALRSIEMGPSFLELEPRFDVPGDSFAFNLNRINFALTLNQQPLLIYLDYSIKTRQGIDTKFLNLGLRVDVPIYLPSAGGFSPLLPFSIYSDFLLTSIPDNDENDNLSISSLGIGAGLGFQYTASRFSAGAKVVPVYAFSTQAFSSESGTSKGLIVNVWLMRHRLIGQYGLALGYRYKYIVTNFSDEQYNYKLGLNAITLGVAF